MKSKYNESNIKSLMRELVVSSRIISYKLIYLTSRHNKNSVLLMRNFNTECSRPKTTYLKQS